MCKNILASELQPEQTFLLQPLTVNQQLSPVINPALREGVEGSAGINSLRLRLYVLYGVLQDWKYGGSQAYVIG